MVSFLAFFQTARINFGGLSKADMDYILEVVEKLLKTFPWHNLELASNVAIATGICLCDLIVQISGLLLTADENPVEDRGADSRDTFLNVVIKAMVPSFRNGG